MPHPTPLVICFWTWMAFIAFWMFAGIFANRTRQAESPFARLSHTIPLGLACYLIFCRYNTRPLFLYGELFSTRWTDPVVYVGIFLTAAGIAIAVWARVHLGRYWSGIITLKEGHRLIMSGPYRFVRHPIYTGWLLALLGTALVNGTGDAFAGLLLVTVAFLIKSRREEKLLAREFPAEFPAYKQAVPFSLVPFVY